MCVLVSMCFGVLCGWFRLSLFFIMWLALLLCVCMRVCVCVCVCVCCLVVCNCSALFLLVGFFAWCVLFVRYVCLVDYRTFHRTR